MLGDMNVDDDWGVVFHIELQIVEIFEGISHLFDPSLQRGLDFVVFFFRFEDHVLHGVHLERSHPCAWIELQVFQCFLLAFYQVTLHSPRKKLHPAVDAFLHALLLLILNSLQLSLVLIFLFKHNLMAQQAVGVVSIEELGLDLPCAYLTMFFLCLEEILIAIHADCIQDVVFLFAFLAGYSFLLLLRWHPQEMAANLAEACGLLEYACAHRTCILGQLLHDRLWLFVPVHAFRTRVDIFADPCVAIRTNPCTIAHHFYFISIALSSHIKEFRSLEFWSFLYTFISQ